MIIEKDIVFQDIKREVELFLKKEKLLNEITMLNNVEWKKISTVGSESPFSIQFRDGSKLLKILFDRENLIDSEEYCEEYCERIELALSDIFDKYDYFFELDDDKRLYLSHL